MRNSINRTGKNAGVMGFSFNRYASTIRFRIGRKVIAIVITALLVSSSLTNRAGAADGDLDPSFDGDAKVTTDFGSGEGVQALAV